MRKKLFFKSCSLLGLVVLNFLLQSSIPQSKSFPQRQEVPAATLVKRAPPKLAPAPKATVKTSKKITKTSSKTPACPMKKTRLVVLDAGHGGKDFGAHSKKNRYEEKKLTLMTTQMVQNYLKQMGYEVVMTRTQDSFIELEKRAEIANKLNADLFVSIHYNFAPSPEAEGIEVYCFRDEKNPSCSRMVESKKVAEKVLNMSVKHTNAHSRGVRKANFAVIRETKMPAILIECGFLSNPQERKKILEVPYRRYLAFGIASGIDRYLGGGTLLVSKNVPGAN